MQGTLFSPGSNKLLVTISVTSSSDASVFSVTVVSEDFTSDDVLELFHYKQSDLKLLQRYLRLSKFF